MTMMVTNAVLGGIADTVAQSITAISTRTSSTKSIGLTKQDEFSIEMHELDRKSGDYDRGISPNPKALPPSFDFERLTRFMAYGFCVAPLQFKWFRFLERAFPMTKTSALGPAMKRVIFDQLVYAPFGVGLFFVAMTVAEGGGRRAVSQKLRDMYVPTLKANYVVWPAVQIVNFRLMPVQFQLVCLVIFGGFIVFNDNPLIFVTIQSPLSRPLVLRGRLTCRSQTPPTRFILILGSMKQRKFSVQEYVLRPPSTHGVENRGWFSRHLYTPINII